MRPCLPPALAVLAVLAAPLPGAAAAVTARHTLAAGTILVHGDLALDPKAEGDLADPSDAVGRQLRSIVYEGRPIPMASLVAPVLVDRNQLVVLSYVSGGLTITTEGRALGRGGAGDTIRVLNTASRVTVTATIQPDGTLAVVQRH